MKITKVLKLQRELDTAVEKAHNVTREEVKERKLIALLVELGEFANEVSMFKYWKKNKNIDEQLMLEEYADCIHFFASYLVDIEINDEVIEPLVFSEDLNSQFLELYKRTTTFLDQSDKEKIETFRMFVGVGHLLNFKWDEVVEHYVRKNQINFDRIKNNY